MSTTRITFVVDLGNGITEQRVTSGRAYSHAVCNERCAISWHTTEHHAREAAAAIRRRRLAQGVKADGIFVLPAIRLDDAQKAERRRELARARAADPKVQARLLKRALATLEAEGRRLERAERFVADVNANVLDTRTFRGWVGTRQVEEERPVVLVRAGGWVWADQAAALREHELATIAGAPARIARAEKLVATHRKALAKAEKAAGAAASAEAPIAASAEPAPAPAEAPAPAGEDTPAALAAAASADDRWVFSRSADHAVALALTGDGRLSMRHPSGCHSVLLDYPCGTDNTRDRALIHAAGFLHAKGCDRFTIARLLSELDGVTPDGRIPGTYGERDDVRCGMLSGLQSVAAGCARVPPAGVAATAEYKRGRRIAELVAPHVGFAHAPVVA